MPKKGSGKEDNVKFVNPLEGNGEAVDSISLKEVKKKKKKKHDGDSGVVLTSQDFLSDSFDTEQVEKGSLLLFVSLYRR